MSTIQSLFFDAIGHSGFLTLSSLLALKDNTLSCFSYLLMFFSRYLLSLFLLFFCLPEMSSPPPSIPPPLSHLLLSHRIRTLASSSYGAWFSWNFSPTPCLAITVFTNDSLPHQEITATYILCKYALVSL